MTKVQRRALKARVAKNLKFQKAEFRKLSSIASRYHIKSDRFFKAAYSNVRKDIRLFKKINAKLH